MWKPNSYEQVGLGFPQNRDSTALHKRALKRITTKGGMKKEAINSELDEENDLLFFTIAGNLHKGHREKGKQYHLKRSVLRIANVQKRVYTPTSRG